MEQQELFRWKFGMRVKLKRSSLGMSQTDLAKKLGYSEKSAISKIESGNAEPPLSKLESFADALETSVAYLMGWENKETDIAEEEQLLFYFRQLNNLGKRQLLNLARNFSEDSDLVEKNNTDTTVSA